MADREVLYEHVMEPGTGKAVPVMRGQILRIEQIGNGQCADFNAFNLHNFTCTGNGGCQNFNTTVGDVNFGAWGGSVTGPRNIQLVGRIEF